MGWFKRKKPSEVRHNEAKSNFSHVTTEPAAISGRNWNAIAKRVRIAEGSLAVLEDRVSALRRDVNRIDKQRPAQLKYLPVEGRKK